MEKLVAMMAFCEAPLDGTLAPRGGAVDSASATGGGGNVLDAAVKKWPMEKLVATMAFCEAPLDGTFDGTSAPSLGAAGYGSSVTSVGGVVALLDAAVKKWPVERLVATMAFCEAPLEGTLDGTSAPSSGGARGCGSASATNAPEAAGGGDAAALRRAWLADAKKEWPLPSQRLMCEKAGTVVDGLAIFETVALQ